MVVCHPRTGTRLVDALHADAARHVAVRDCSSEVIALSLLGRNASKVLAALGVYGRSGDPREAKPFARGSVDGLPSASISQPVGTWSPRAVATLIALTDP